MALRSGLDMAHAPGKDAGATIVRSISKGLSYRPGAR
jgi:hypothetical protein